MAQMNIYRRKADDYLEAIAGECAARPLADYDRFPIDRADLGDNAPGDVYRMDGDKLVNLSKTEQAAIEKDREKAVHMQDMHKAQADLEASKKIAADGVDTTKEQAEIQAKYDAAKSAYTSVGVE